MVDIAAPLPHDQQPGVAPPSQRMLGDQFPWQFVVVLVKLGHVAKGPVFQPAMRGSVQTLNTMDEYR
jgi:hypothetical protein